MTRIAYQDALTRVKSKAAFDVEMKELNKMIHDGKESFAMVMMDLNELKKMNDEYGHDMGDKYLVGGCKQMCIIYKHSPIFRIGGDEFVAVLRGGDYENRNLLLSKIKSSFRESSDDMSRKPWERYSAAAGMAEHLPGDDETAQDVLKRADIEMYNDKKKIKAKEK
jgi:diguanylate cyclase (GGDEF)-like protein